MGLVKDILIAVVVQAQVVTDVKLSFTNPTNTSVILFFYNNFTTD